MSDCTFQLEHLPADVLGLSHQARATLGGRPEPASVPGMVVPVDVHGFPPPLGTFDPDDRARLARILETELERLLPHDFVLANARAVAHPDATLVVAGQQPAFLGGPLYNVYKALHAVRLARDLSQA